jgi:hypothetical protein
MPKGTIATTPQTDDEAKRPVIENFVLNHLHNYEQETAIT